MESLAWWRLSGYISNESLAQGDLPVIYGIMVKIGEKFLETINNSIQT